MQPLTAIERFFERLFERPSARLFRTHVQPVQIQQRIERAMETGRRVSGERTVVPNRFIVHLNPDDLAGFADIADDLPSGLADEALSFARAHRYALAERPRVDLVADPTVQRADIRIDARHATPEAGGGAASSTGGSGAARPGGPPRPAPSGEPADPMATAVFPVPSPALPRAIVHVTDPDGRSRAIAVPPGGLTIGRTTDNDLVARDVRVSRHHGRIATRRGTLVYEDLGSTNGSKVNGELVSAVVLGVGDRLQIGDTLLVLEVEEPAG
jgi:hypothetical protein